MNRRRRAAPSSSERVRAYMEGERIFVVELNYPSKHNVLDQRGWAALGNAVEDAGDRSGARVVLIQGAGSKAFSTGSDIAAFGDQRDGPEAVAQYGRTVHRALSRIEECPIPTLALVEGLCVGGGLLIAAVADIVVASRRSRFGAPINRLGLTMSFEELRPLLAAVGRKAALELLLAGELIDSERAREIGIAQRIVSDGEARKNAFELANTIASGAPLVNRWHKKFVRRLSDPRPLEAEERAESYRFIETRDYREGVRAFLKKRPPDFRGE